MAAGPPSLASDARRNLVSLGASAVVTAVGTAVYSAFVGEPFSVDLVILVAFAFWTVYGIAYLVLTMLTFGRADATQLSEWMLASNTRRAGKRTEADLSGSGPSLTVQWAVLAIVAVGIVSLSPALTDSALANALSFAVVASSWLVTVAAYAVHYARVNTLHQGLDFPGSAKGMVFMDYVYLAAQVSTTFGTSDVSVTNTRVRRVVTGHTLVAFLFSTFIIALLISLIFLTD